MLRVSPAHRVFSTIKRTRALSNVDTFAMSSTEAPVEIITGPRAAVCVVGNEVLSGKTQDTNSHFIAKFLFRRGIDLVRIAVIPDELDIITNTVKELSNLVGPDGYVFTTGGIGPTHDDITYEGVARAFGRGLEMHQPTIDALMAALAARGASPDFLNEDMKRMALLPAGCNILTTNSWVPLANLHNVYVLPGIPRLVKEMIEHNEDHFKGVPIHRAIIHTLTWEGVLAGELKQVQKRHPTVAIGSYVNLSDDKTGKRDETYNTRLTVDGRNAEEVERVAEEIIRVTNGFRFVPPATL